MDVSTPIEHTIRGGLDLVRLRIKTKTATIFYQYCNIIIIQNVLNFH